MTNTEKFYHIYYGKKPIFKALNEEEYEFIWEKLMWVYNDDISFVEFTESREDKAELAESSF
jgi:hypothetical protein